MSQLKPLPEQAYQFFLGQSLPEFDQIVKGNVCIKKLSKYRYRITYSKIGKFLMYQVWNKDDANKQNDNRIVKYVSAKEWVTLFKKINNNILKENKKPLFTPTAIMETENRVYAFVIHTVDLNSYDKVVFTVSTKEISLQNNTSKKLIQLPLGKCNDVRFDIDSSIFPFPSDDSISCMKNKTAEEISKNYKFSITRDDNFSDDDLNYERYIVNVPVQILISNLSYSGIEINDNDNGYFVNGLKNANYTTESTTIFLSKGVVVTDSRDDSGDFDGYFAIDKGIVKYFLINNSVFDTLPMTDPFPRFDSISFINIENIKINCPYY
jgi:hypothetical protein